jgi:hypothetical protein
MQVRQLCQVVVNAEGLREASWHLPEGKQSWCYSLSLDEALNQAFAVAATKGPKLTASEAEKQMAWFLIRHAWNDVQDWAKL